MKSRNATRHTLAHPHPDRAHLHPSRRRVLAAPVFRAAANQRKVTDSLGFSRPFIPSSPRPDARLRAERIGGFIRAFPATSPTHERRSCGPSPSGYDLHPASPLPGDRQPNRSGRSHTARTFRHPLLAQTDGYPPACPFPSPSPGFHVSRPGRQSSPPMSQTDHIHGRASGQIRFALAGSTRTAYQRETPVSMAAFTVAEASRHPAQCDLINQVPLPCVRQDSDFPWEIAERFLTRKKISALRASGALRVNPFSFYQRSTSAA